VVYLDEYQYHEYVMWYGASWGVISNGSDFLNVGIIDVHSWLQGLYMFVQLFLCFMGKF